jgi:hypothetical protein
LQRAGRHAQLGADGRQRDTHHRDVDALEEDRPGQDEQQAPRARGHAFLARWGGLCGHGVFSHSFGSFL